MKRWLWLILAFAPGCSSEACARPDGGEGIVKLTAVSRELAFNRGLFRFEDRQAGVVCYIFSSQHPTLSCVKVRD